MTRKKK
jgi:hypothetical protein